MFTGLIEFKTRILANIKENQAHRLVLEAPFTDTIIGESIAVNGVCLTLLAGESDFLAFDVSPETLTLTTLGALTVGDQVNLERAMSATSRFGGHYVSGHVDTTARLESLNAIGDYTEIVVGDWEETSYRYLLPKGSITLDGVSLTINAVDESGIKLMLVPHTLAHTTLGQMKAGQRLNVEFDYFTRIVAHQLTLSGLLKSEIVL